MKNQNLIHARGFQPRKHPAEDEKLLVVAERAGECHQATDIFSRLGVGDDPDAGQSILLYSAGRFFIRKRPHPGKAPPSKTGRSPRLRPLDMRGG
jgi:hypothetical protein